MDLGSAHHPVWHMVGRCITKQQVYHHIIITDCIIIIVCVIRRMYTDLGVIRIIPIIGLVMITYPFSVICERHV